MEALALENPAGMASEARRLAAGRLAAAADRAWQLAFQVTGSAGRAEDAVQQAYLSVLGEAPPGLPADEERLWFFRVVINAARKQLRGDLRRAKREELYMRDKAAALSGPAPGEDLVAALRQAMAELDEQHRLPVALCCEQGLTHRQAAAVLDLPKTTVARHVSEGLEDLRRRLARAGHTAAPAMVIGGLAQAAPPVPATLAAMVEKLLAAGVATRGSSAAAAAAAAKGGLAVKIIAGVVLAGALAGGTALFFGPPTAHRLPPTDLASPPAKADAGPKKLVAEPYAGCGIQGWLDGPRLETMWNGQGCGGYPDKDFNLYSGWRCIRADGRVVTIIGNDYWSLEVCNEGPAASMPNVLQGSGYGQHSGELVVMGNPIEGGDKDGFFAVSDANVYRIWKNKEKGGRWWFKKVLGQDAGMGGIWTAHATKDGRLILFSEKGFYAYADGKLALLLGTEAWQAALPKDDKGRTCTATQGLLGGDGHFYLGTYYAGPPLILRVSPDGKKAEQYVSDVNGADGQGHRDGAGIGTGWFCGPHLAASRSNPRFAPPDCIFPSTHDDSDLRRVRDGRVSTLCEDGEWRELKTPRGDASGRALYEFRGVTMGPNGTALVTFGKGIGGRCGIIRGIDYAKPTVGPKAE